MGRFNCRFCGFSINHAPRDDKCPYCNKKDAMREEECAEGLVGEA